MSINYLFESAHIVDYDLWSDSDIPFVLRGPQPIRGAQSPTVAFLGAAQTFGAFVKCPFPTLISDMLSCQALNLGRGGAGPGLYLKYPRIIERINAAECAVIQVMSARSSMRNSMMESTDELASVTIKHGNFAGQKMLGHLALKAIGAELDETAVAKLYDETMSNYVRQFEELISLINVPVVVLYLGRRPPLSSISTTAEKASRFRDPGLHPHMVDEDILERLGAIASATVSVFNDVGAKSKLVNRFTGSYQTISRPSGLKLSNHEAYISPYLHARTAIELFPLISKFIGHKNESRQ